MYNNNVPLLTWPCENTKGWPPPEVCSGVSHNSAGDSGDVE